MSEEPRRLSHEEVAKQLGVSVRTLHELRRSRLIGHVRPSERRIHYTQAQVDEYLARAVRPPKPAQEADDQSPATADRSSRGGASFSYMTPEQAERKLDQLLAKRGSRKNTRNTKRSGGT